VVLAAGSCGLLYRGNYSQCNCIHTRILSLIRDQITKSRETREQLKSRETREVSYNQCCQILEKEMGGCFLWLVIKPGMEWNTGMEWDVR